MPATVACRRLAPASAGSWWLLAVWTFTVAGLNAMHQLAGLSGLGAHEHGVAGASMPAPDPGPDAEAHCPEDSHSHPAHVCQPASPSQHSGTTPPTLVVAVAPAAVTAAPVLPRTAADDAAGGSGCGPPVLAQLSVLRI